MERKMLTINGINRPDSTTSIPNLNCLEVINARFKDDAWREVKPKTLHATTANEYEVIFVHNIDTVKNWIGWDNTNNRIVLFSGLTETVLMSLNVDSVRFQSVGYILVLYTKIGDTVQIYYMLYDRTTGAYGEYVDFDFEIPLINFFQQNNKYSWVFAHKVTRPGGEMQVNWIGLNAVGELYYFKENSDVKIGDVHIPYSTPDPENYFRDGIAKFVSEEIFSPAYAGNLYIYIKNKTVLSDADKNLTVYNNITDTYGTVSYTNLPYLTNITEIAAVNATFDPQATGYINSNFPIDVSAGTTISEKLAIIDGKYLESKSDAQKRGYFEGFVYVTYAFKLFDGTYVKYSFPRLIYVGVDNFDTSAFGRLNLSTTEVSLSGFEFKTLGMYIPIGETSNITSIISKYEKLIISLDIFMTAPIPRFDFSTRENFIMQGWPIKKLSEQTVFYKIKSIPLKELSEWIKTIEPINAGLFLSSRTMREEKTGANVYNHYNEYLNAYINLNDIITFEAMPLDNYTAHKLYADRIFKYNNRLMLSNTIQKLFKGFSPQWLLGLSSTGTAVTIFFEVKLETTEGIKYVRSIGMNQNSATTITMPELFGYPDNRAKSFRILAQQGGTGAIKLVREIELTKHITQNFSYYMAPNLYQDYELELENDNTFRINETISFNTTTDIITPWASLTTPTYPAGTLDTVTDNNKISVTEVNNPFVFPARLNYQVGNSEIVGLASNADPVSQGQFGAFPVIVFTKTGIWTLNINETGETYIGSITPLNDEVCTNPDSITTVLGAVFFVSGKDIKMVKGGQIGIASKPLHGDYESPAKTEAIYTTILALTQMFHTSTALCEVDFETYLAGAKIAFNKLSDEVSEVIITNDTYGYSFLYNTKYQIWYKISESWDKVLQDYPNFYGINGLNIYDLESETTADSQIFIETQAIEFSPDAMVKLERMRIDLTASLSSTKYLGIYILGSIDGLKWNIVNGKEIGPGATVTNPVMYGTRVSLGFLKLIVSTECQNIMLKNIITEYGLEFTTKLR